MDYSVLLAFFISSLLLAIAPGPDNIFVLSQSALYGVRSGFLIVLGLCTGLIFHTTLVVLGVSAIIVANVYLFLSVKIIGALYLLYLAKLAFFSKALGHGTENKGVVLSGFKLYLRGVIMNITNPKVIVFFLAFFPQFVKTGTSAKDAMLQMFIQGLLFMLATFIVFNVIALLSGSLKYVIKSPKFEWYLNKISGIIFVGLAISAFLV